MGGGYRAPGAAGLDGAADGVCHGSTPAPMSDDFRLGITLHEPEVTEVQTDYVSIKNRPEGDRPRERLLQHGPAALSDAELIGLVFGSGTRVGGRSVSAVELGQALLQAYGSLDRLARRDAAQVAKATKGVGPRKGGPAGRRLRRSGAASRRRRLRTASRSAARPMWPRRTARACATSTARCSSYSF